MRTPSRVALAGALLLCTAGATAAKSPHATDARPTLAVPLHEAIYHATVRGIPVRASLRLEQQGEDLYLYSSEVEPRGLLSFVRRELTETSLVRLAADGTLVPISYRKHDGVGGRDSDMRFDVGNRTLRIDYRGEQNSIDWEPGIYDLLSLRLVLAHDVARDALAASYRIVDDRGRVEEVDVEIVGRERISTEIGEVDTLRLEYRSARRDRLFKLWIAPDREAALVRLEQHEAGRLRGRLQIVEYRRLGDAAAR